MASRLHVTAGPDQGRIVPVPGAGRLTLGRSKAQVDLALNDPQISRVHCEIAVEGNQVTLTDLDSSGGTLVNGRKIAKHVLKHGDVIRLGASQLAYQADGEAQPAAVAQAGEKKAGPPKLEELVGKTVSHYELTALIAKGQSGVVFKATDQKTGQAVALKVLQPEFAQNEEEMQRFIRAMKTMMPLCHPNLVTLFGAGRSGPFCWVAMEYVEGESLTQVIQRIGKDGILDWKIGLRVAVHVARALNYAHGESIIHRNITPPNVLIRKADGQTLLGDLMLAKAQEGALAQQITKPGELLGDVAYMSPERTKGTKDIDHRSDLYGLGAAVYALLTGHPPFQGVSLLDTIQKIRAAEPKPIKPVQPAIPDTFEQAVLKMLAKKPEDRFQAAAQVLAILERSAKMSGTTV
jgi:serine/threonine protein kinase